MKKGVLILLIVFSLTLVSSTTCDLNVSLLNQDPYPAVPGDYVKLVFEIDGLDDVDCNDITFQLLGDYPLRFDPGETGIRKFNKIDYIKDYESNILVPFKVRIDEDALDGINPIEANIQNKGETAKITETFSLEVEDVKADFEVYVTDYNYNTKELTIEVLNIEDVDIEALTVEIPKQDNIEVKGSNRVVVGDLDSNEYTSADFEATINNGEIQINLIYSDKINVRRTVQKTVQFDSSYFTGRNADQKSTGIGTYIIIILIIVGVVYYFYNRRKKRIAREKKHQLHK